MKILQEQFEYRGYTYRQLERTAHAAIYAQYSGDDIIAYEVIRVTVTPQREVMGRQVEEGEYYPGDSVWGTHGFTCLNLERAMEVYAMLNDIKPKDNEGKD